MERLHDSVFQQHGITLRADAEADRRAIHFQPNRLCEIAVAVRKKLDRLLSPARLRPCIHHENIVDRGASYCSDALRLELSGVLQKSRKVHPMAGRRERAWN